MARHRQIRVDWHTHPKTTGLSPLARDLVVQALCANVAGLLERSARRMAALAGGSTTAQDVEAALVELTSPRGPKGEVVAMWWPDLEILWVVEAADEQAKGMKAWEGAEALAAAAPEPVRRAFADRYRERLSDRLAPSYQIGEAGATQGRSGASPLPAPAPVPESVPAPGRARARDVVTPSRGEPAPSPALRNQPPDEQALDDPDVRSLGDVVVRNDGPITIDTLRWARAEFVRGLDGDGALRVPEFNRNPKTVAGILDAVRTYGEEVVWQVVRWAWGEAAAGRLDETKLACTFHGSGFGVRLKDWRKAQEHERRRARLGLKRGADAAPLPDHDEFFGLADQLEHVTARLRGEA